MGVLFGREYGMLTLDDYQGVPIQPLRCVRKWGRALQTFAEQRIEADLTPLRTPHQGVSSRCFFKLYEEIPGESGLERDLLIECKMSLTRLDYLGRVYQLYLFPLRGTDIWAVLEMAQQALGPVQTMVFDDPGLSVYFAAETQ